MSGTDQSSNTSVHGSVESGTNTSLEHVSTSTSTSTSTVTQQSLNSSNRIQTYIVDSRHSTPYASLNDRNINGSRSIHIDDMMVPQSVVQAVYNMRGDLRRFDDAFNRRR